MADIDSSFERSTKAGGEFFRDPNEPASDIAGMFASLDEAGHLPKAMRKALLRHAENAINDTPRHIAALARAVAAASNEGWMDKSDVTSAAYGLAHMAEAMGGYAAILEQFGAATSHEA